MASYPTLLFSNSFLLYIKFFIAPPPTPYLSFSITISQQPRMPPSLFLLFLSSCFTFLLFWYFFERRGAENGQAFSVIAPKLWNKLPLNILSSPSISFFKCSLKLSFIYWISSDNNNNYSLWLSLLIPILLPPPPFLLWS